MEQEYQDRIKLIEEKYVSRFEAMVDYLDLIKKGVPNTQAIDLAGYNNGVERSAFESSYGLIKHLAWTLASDNPDRRNGMVTKLVAMNLRDHTEDFQIEIEDVLIKYGFAYRPDPSDPRSFESLCEQNSFERMKKKYQNKEEAECQSQTAPETK